MQAILETAIEEYRRQRFLHEANAAYAALRNDPKQWKEELAERIVGLYWRLRRAERYQNAVFETLYDKYAAEVEQPAAGGPDADFSEVT